MQYHVVSGEHWYVGMGSNPLSCDSECYRLCLRSEHMMLLMNRQQQFASSLPVMLGEFPDSTSKSVHILFQPQRYHHQYKHH